MTRNNLDEHLRWLLSAKASIPPEVTDLPPVSTSSASAVTRFEADRVSSGTKSFAPAVSIVQKGSRIVQEDAERKDEMVRTRTAPSSASKPHNLTRTIQVEASPSRTPRQPKSQPPRQLEHLAIIATVRRTPQPCRYAATPTSVADVEIMDLTGERNMNLSPAVKSQTPSNTGRKRKSEEFERDLHQPTPSKRRTPRDHLPIHPSQEFPLIDEIMDSPPPTNVAPLEPPPPYSTIAPVATSPSRRLQAQLANKFQDLKWIPELGDESFASSVSYTGTAGMRLNLPRTKPTLPRCSQDEPKSPYGRHDIVQKDGKLLTDAKIVQYPQLPALHAPEQRKLPTSEHLAPQASASVAAPVARIPGQEQPPPSRGTQSSSQEMQESMALLERFFRASNARFHQAVQAIETLIEEIVDHITERIDQELSDDPALDQKRNELDDRKNALKKLRIMAPKQQKLLQDKDQCKKALREAVSNRLPTEAVRLSNIRAADRLKAFTAECEILLKTCDSDVRAIIDDDQCTSFRAVAVQSTQMLETTERDRELATPSSSRIVQTQGQLGLSQTQTTKAYIPFCSKSYENELPHALGERQRNDIARTRDSMDRDLGDPPLIGSSDTDRLFSNRMGTPPARYDFEEDYGMDDDDAMLDHLEDYENQVQSKPNRSASHPRPGLPEANAKLASPAKSRKSQAKSTDELNRKNFSHPWSSDVSEILKQVFRLKGFRANQIEAINATLAGKDTFVLMPTGGGKSLCYQLPALVRTGTTQGVTLVISPLVSLMEDQVQHLRNLSIQAFLINSETSREERNLLMDKLKDECPEKFVQLLYITPEMLGKSRAMMNCFEKLSERKRLARLVIDEAHCVSQWGHDFRPDYVSIGNVRRQFPRVPVMALTATATENVKFDTIHNLGIKGCEVFTRSFNRPNLYYEVRRKTKGYPDYSSLADLIKEKHSKQTGIIYCLSRKNCEDMAKGLQELGIKAQHYHAGMETDKKSQTQKAWQAGSHHVIVATIAFGMGIDKANVRYVIHHSMPKSLEGYYQETGRAGRDGKHSSCYLFYGYSDAAKLRRMIDDGEGSAEQKDRQRQMLQKMTQYCDNQSDCRRVQVLAYFKESFDREACRRECDNCNSKETFVERDFTRYAQRAVNLVTQVSKNDVTLLYSVDVFRGATNKKMKALHHNELDDFAAGKDIDRGDVERLFYRLLLDDAIQEENYLNKKGFAQQYIRLGSRWNQYHSGRTSLKMLVRAAPSIQSKPRAPKTKKKGATRDMPMSTNISSPIQANSKSKRPLRQAGFRDIHAHEYERDGFVVSDPESNQFCDDDDETDDGCEAMNWISSPRDPRKVRVESRATENVFGRLNHIHEALIDEFLYEAEKKVKEIMKKKSLKMAPFSNTILREMAIKFANSNEEMLQIDGIDPERVRLYGKHFHGLLRTMKERHDELIAEVTSDLDGDAEDQHAQNVIDLVSDDEDYGSTPEDFNDEDEEEAGERSHFFEQSADVHDFNAKFEQSQSAAMRTRPDSQAFTRSPKSRKTYKAQMHRKSDRSTKSSGRMSEGTSGRSRSISGTTARKKHTARRPGGALRVTAAKKRGGAHSSAISMMPT